MPQQRKNKGHEPVGTPIQKNSHRHGTVTRSHGKDFGNDKPGDATWTKGKRYNDTGHGQDGNLRRVTKEW